MDAQQGLDAVRLPVIKLGALTAFSDEQFRRLLGGYTSAFEYQAAKNETPAGVTISLELHPLQQPYVKTWETTPAELRRYRTYLEQGFSLGAFEGDRLIGLAIAEPQRWNNTLWVWEFGIDPDYRRQGVGQRLMQALAEKAQSAEMRAVVCETQSTNAPAIHFYRAMGFEVEGIDLSYYTNEDIHGEVAIFMKLKLAPHKKGEGK